MTHRSAGYIAESWHVYEHVAVAERALGKKLPSGVEIHHVNEDKTDNRPQNLVVCQNRAYHDLLHLRQEAYFATGNARARRCRYCKRWDMPTNLIHTQRKLAPNGDGSWRHKGCQS